MSKNNFLYPIPGYPNYAVRKSGRVFSYKTNRYLQARDNRGYDSVVLYKDKKSKAFLVHRLILLTFVGESGLDVNHIDCDKRNNRLRNLEYCDKVHNMRHAENHNLISHCRGVKHGRAQLTEHQVRAIRSDSEHTQDELAGKYVVSQTLISKIKLNRLWKHI